MVSKTKQNFSLYLPQSSLSTLLELDQFKTQKATMSDTTLDNHYYQVQIVMLVYLVIQNTENQKVEEHTSLRYTCTGNISLTNYNS